MLTARFLKLFHVLSQRHAHGVAAEVPPHLHNALDMLKHAPVDLIQVSWPGSSQQAQVDTLCHIILAFGGGEELHHVCKGGNPPP